MLILENVLVFWGAIRHREGRDVFFSPRAVEATFHRGLFVARIGYRLIEERSLGMSMAEGLLQTGATPPDFGFGSEDIYIRLTELRNVYRVFIAFCPHGLDDMCKEGMYAVRDNWDAFQKRDVVAILVSSDNEDTLADFADSNNVPFVLISDEDQLVSSGYGAASSAEAVVYLIGKDGTVKAAWQGWPPVDEVLSLIDSMSMWQQEMEAA